MIDRSESRLIAQESRNRDTRPAPVPRAEPRPKRAAVKAKPHK